MLGPPQIWSSHFSTLSFIKFGVYNGKQIYLSRLLPTTAWKLEKNFGQREGRVRDASSEHLMCVFLETSDPGVFQAMNRSVEVYGLSTLDQTEMKVSRYMKAVSPPKCTLTPSV